PSINFSVCLGKLYCKLSSGNSFINGCKNNSDCDCVLCCRKCFSISSGKIKMVSSNLEPGALFISPISHLNGIFQNCKLRSNNKIGIIFVTNSVTVIDFARYQPL